MLNKKVYYIRVFCNLNVEQESVFYTGILQYSRVEENLQGNQKFIIIEKDVCNRRGTLSLSLFFEL
jgi:hypothetical protein